jgi:hypothetical protein
MRTIDTETAQQPTQHDHQPQNQVPEEAFAAAFGDPDRVRIAIWIDRAAPAHGGLFALDACAARLDLPEATVRSALKPLRQLGMVRYRNGLYERCEHVLWSVLATLRGDQGTPRPLGDQGTPRSVGAQPPLGEPRPLGEQPRGEQPLGESQPPRRARPDLAASFYFG